MRISKNVVFDMFLLMPFFKLPGFSEYKVISSIFDLWFVLSSAYIIFRALRFRYRPSMVTTVVIVREIYMFLLTVHNGGFSTPLIRNTLGAAMVCILIDYELNRNSKAMCKAIASVFTTYTVLNLLCGNGMFFETYLFGQRTNLTVIAFPMMIIMAICATASTNRREKRTFRKEACLIMMISTFLILKESVSTAILGMAICVILYVVFYWMKFDKIPAKAYVILIAIYNFIIVVVQNFDYMRFIFENLLGESMTMTGRLVIWNNAMLAFLQKPLFGHGYAMFTLSRGRYATSTSYAHNDFLQHCVEGGSIDLILFVLLMVLCVRYLKKYSSSKLKSVMLAGLIGLEVTMISEVPSSLNYFFVLLILIEYFSRQENKLEKRSSRGGH